MANRIAIFNHKGGVGKTLTAFNLGWKLTQMGQRVLLVDGDSQVNLSALTLGVDLYDDYFDNQETKTKNIKDGVAGIFEGKPSAIEPFDCPTAPKNRDLFLLPGHSDLATYEGQLSLAQETKGSLSALQNLPGALHALISQIEDHHKVDFTIVDLNPGLGALNQNLFLSTDAFIIPTNPDPFSLMAIDTLSDHVVRWAKWQQNSLSSFSGSDYPLSDTIPKFLGTVNSRFNKHKSKAAKKFDERIKAIDQRVEKYLIPCLKPEGMLFSSQRYARAFSKWKNQLNSDDQGKYALARVPDFQSLIHSANNQLLPIFSLTRKDLKEDGLAGTVLDTALENSKSFDRIFDIIAEKSKYLLNV